MFARDESQPAWNDDDRRAAAVQESSAAAHGRCVVSAAHRYRLSPQGVLVKRDLGRTSGWTDPHWRVVDIAPGERRHYITQLLTDAAVASWTALVAVREPEREVAR